MWQAAQIPKSPPPQLRPRGSADGQGGEAGVATGRGTAGHRNRHRHAAVHLAPPMGMSLIAALSASSPWRR
ncbi:hypothetical protein GGTG_03105 [Gaeumannomyces tritici R3-111a-1]|uniref:Uncharacterized protein n=1 Tax=Gaeumannomyces tritici (strain R3-111a-1) TaxID=644352 RepID=J3NP99_GAET3|nr:hypothetical protein GGTG_03105 [Gaeumannomyces tritici R3-111a-1]EJT78002.1 hypothetical protein GGTG_03105 [Gaeumannomyces tritici R3-111a-1]